MATSGLLRLCQAQALRFVQGEVRSMRALFKKQLAAHESKAGELQQQLRGKAQAAADLGAQLAAVTSTAAEAKETHQREIEARGAEQAALRRDLDAARERVRSTETEMRVVLARADEEKSKTVAQLRQLSDAILQHK